MFSPTPPIGQAAIRDPFEPHENMLPKRCFFPDESREIFYACENAASTQLFAKEFPD